MASVRRGRRRPARPLAVASFIPLLILLALPNGAHGQWRLAEWEGGELELGGYLRSLTALQESALSVPGEDDTGVFAGQVLRLVWKARGERWHLAVHDRLQGRVSSRGGQGSVVGFGVSAVPGRSVDLETELAEGEQYRVWHDLDRLALTLYTGAADVTIGRQAITWGLSSLFPVADLWARFSPFELDTEHKPGIDAVRVLAYPMMGLEVEGVVADRGSAEDLSLGGRATLTLPDGDLWLGGGKLWREAVVAVGGSVLLEEVKLRAEAVFPWTLSDEAGIGEEGAQDPRVTVGADWIRGDWTVVGELHFNGIGAGDPDGYVEAARDPRFARGESYYLGRWYAGGLVSHAVTDRLSVSGTVLANLADPSASLTPAVRYDLGRSARISVGGLLSLGEDPSLRDGPGGVPAPAFESEFGTYGRLGWTQVSVYF